MASFAQKLPASERRESPGLARPSALVSATAQVHPILQPQRTTGNQAVRSLLEVDRRGMESNSSSTGTLGLGHDFSRIPIHSHGADFQQVGPGAGLDGDATDVMLDQQTDSPVDQEAAPPTSGNDPDAGTLPPPTPLQAQASGNDPDAGTLPPPTPLQAQGPAAPLPLTVTFNTRVRAPNTPAAMAPDRIPPGLSFPVGVTIANWHAPMLPIQLSVDGSGGNNGTVMVDGAASEDIVASGTVQLRGTAQTAPGSAGNLVLVARSSGQQLAASNAFSVAAIPQDMVLSSSTPLTGNTRGFVVTQTWSSDSGNLADLDQAAISEAVEYISSTGIFAGLGASNSGYLAASGGSLTDTHGTPVSALTGPGTRVANQTEMFRDNRTGVTDISMRNSGFVINRVVTSQPQPSGSPTLQITTSKQGAAVTANGVASSAGSGSMSLTQQV
jgi:hypothetical protein